MRQSDHHLRNAGSRREFHVRAGFTLLEVTIACFLLTVIAGIATLSLRGRVAANRVRQAVEQLERADRFARQVARRTGNNVTLDFHEAANEIQVSVNRRVQKTYKLPSSTGVSSVRLSKTNSRTVIVSPLGQSPTYAVEFEGAERSRWLIVAGTSGHTLRTTERGHVDALLRF